MRVATSLTALFAVAASAVAMPPVPRKSPEFTIIEASGKQTLLSSLKGKVVVFTFLYTTCPHCQAEAQMVTKLQKELGAKGFQAIGTAFNDPSPAVTTGPTPEMVGAFVQQYGVGYPVGHSSRDQVLSYLGLSMMDQRWVVPQIAVIDRKGMIRAQSEPTGTPDLQTEDFLRKLIVKLLAEGSATTGAAPATKKAPVKTAAVANKGN